MVYNTVTLQNGEETVVCPRVMPEEKWPSGERCYISHCIGTLGVILFRQCGTDNITKNNL